MEFQCLEEDDIIEKVTKPTDWCSPIVPVRKKNDARICMDLKKINSAVKKGTFHATKFGGHIP